MSILIAGLLLFFATHSISIIDEGWRNQMVRRMGLQRWMGVYSLFSLAGFVLIVWGFSLARHDSIVLYTPPPGTAHIVWLLMIPFFPLLIATYLPSHIRSTTKHPMLVATMLWSATHLLINGTLTDLLLFGSFLVWATIDRLSMRHRIQRPLPDLPAGKYNDLIAIVGGLALYAAFLLGVHHWLFNAPLLR